MNNQSRKIIFISIFLVITALAAYFLWRIFTGQPLLNKNNEIEQINNASLPSSSPSGQVIPVRPNTNNNLPTDTGTASQDQPSTPSTGRDNKITSPNNFPILAATLDASGNTVQYYDPLENRFYQLDQNGNPKPLTDKLFYNVDKLSWSPDKSRAIIEYPDGSKNIYNFNDQSQVSLPKHWQEFQFSPSGEQIAFKSIGYETDNRWLSIMNADGSGAQNLEKLGANADKAVVNWSPNRQIVATFQDASDYNRQQIYFIGLNHENFKSLVVQGRGFQSKWSADGNQLLYSVYTDVNEYKPSLWISNASGDSIGQNNRPLEIETWAEKCSFVDDKTIYCAVPRSMSAGAGWLPYSSLDTPDDVYSIDLASGAKTLISSEGTYNMSDLIITKDGSTLYFTDNITGGLYKLALNN
jgi:hypothetical protein